MSSFRVERLLCFHDLLPFYGFPPGPGRCQSRVACGSCARCRMVVAACQPCLLATANNLRGPSVLGSSTLALAQCIRTSTQRFTFLRDTSGPANVPLRRFSVAAVSAVIRGSLGPFISPNAGHPFHTRSCLVHFRQGKILRTASRSSLASSGPGRKAIEG